MKDVLRQAGVPVARHKLVENDGDAWQFALDVGLPIIVKPVDGLGSRGTYRVRTDADLRAALKALRPSMERPVQAEEFVVGAEHTCETVCIDGQPVWRSGTRYFPTPLEVLENPWMQYCVLLPREADDPTWRAFWPTNTAALRALGMETGLSHMEWFRRADGSHVVGEVGARPPGVHIMPMMSLTHGIDMTAAWVRLMVLGQFDPPQRRRAAGTAFFRGQGKGGRVVEVRGLHEAQEEVGVHVVDRSLPKVGQARATGYEGEGWAIVAAEDTDTVKHALLRLVQLVQVRYG
jgi:biotin carboxylase